MAKDADVPVTVYCESVKFTEKVALDSIVTTEMVPLDELTPKGDKSLPVNSRRDLPNLQLLDVMYDVASNESIVMVTTEHGLLVPSSVRSIYRLRTET